MIDKIVHDIKNYETMNIIVKKSNESINIRLLNVALMLEFFINLICLIKIIKKEIHWNIEKKRLHQKEIIFCFVKSRKSHWILEKNFSIDERFQTFKAKSETFKFDLMITNRKWHEMLNHLRSKIIIHLVEKVNQIKIDDFDSASSINRCETCVLIKTHELVSRRFEQEESINYSMNRIDYDLIFINKKYNENYWIIILCVFVSKWISSICILVRTTPFRWFVTTRIKYDQIVWFIRMKNERILRL
jgi:hypothetical protein